MTTLRTNLVLFLAVLVALGATTAFAQDNDRIVGAWNYGQVGCTTNCLDGMFSINAGGTVTGYDNTPVTSPNVGTWRKINRRNFKMRTKNAVYNADGSVNVFILTDGKVTISGDGTTFKFAGILTALNADGSLRKKFPFTLGAARF
jgi:hypothetical protein